jgi:hypothetical protein
MRQASYFIRSRPLTDLRHYLMLWKTPVYTFRVRVNEGSVYLKEFVIDVTGSAPSFKHVEDTMKGVFETLLDSTDGEHITRVLDFGAAKFRNSLYFLKKGKKVAAVEFEELPKRSDFAKKTLQKCKKDPNFMELIFPHPFIAHPEQFDLVLLVNVLPVMPVFAERLLVIDLLYDKVSYGKYVLWYTQPEGGYKKIREAGKNRLGDGLWMGTTKKFKTFFKFHASEDILEMFALYGFKFVRKYSASGNTVILFQKTEHNLIRGILTPERILQAIPREEESEAPKKVEIARVKKTEEKQEIIPNPYCLSIEKLYAEALRAIPSGGENGNPEKYHRLVSQIILRIFRGALRNMEIKPDMNKGLAVLDTIYSNEGGFIAKFEKDSGLKCPYVVLEAKNYSFDLENPEFNQIQARLIDGVGKLGLLVCRNIDDNEKAKEHCDAALDDGDKHLILLTDEEILGLLDLSADGDTNAINDFMDKKIRALRLKSKK